MKTAQIKLYQFAELSKEAKLKAIQDHKEFLNLEPEDFEDSNGQLIKKYVRHSTQTTIESIELNEYYFFYDGSLASVTHYAINHPKAGKMEFKFKGQTIPLS